MSLALPTSVISRLAILCSLLLTACSAQYGDFEGDPSKADDEGAACLFGESWDQWDEGLPGLFADDGWSVIDADTVLWDGAIEQMIVALDFPGGPTDFEGMLAETDNEEFLYKELVDVERDEEYVALGYLGGDNFHGAIMPVGSSEAVARLADPDVFDCTVFQVTAGDSCDEQDGYCSE